MKQNKKERLPLKRIVSDNLYVLKLIHKAAPGLLFAYIFMTAFGAAASFFSNTYLLRTAINGMAEGRSFWEIAALALAFLAVNLAVEITSTILNHGVLRIKSLQGIRDMNMMVYKKAASAELACYENPEFYNDFQKVIDDNETRFNAVINSVLRAVHQVVTFSANLGLLIAIDPILLIFVTVPLLLSPLRAISNKLGFKRTMDTNEVNRRRNYSRRVFYLSDYAKEMRLTNMPFLMLKRFRQAGRENLKILKKYGLKIGTITYIVEECKELLCCMAANVYAIFKTVAEKTMLLGDCVIVINSVGQIAWTLADTATVMLSFQENALYIENLRKFMDYEPKIKSGNKPLPDGDIVLENVSFRYDGAEDYTLKNVSMRFGKNEKIAIVGHNGAGKTTLTKLLLRLYDCEGSITYGGTDIKELNLADYRDAFSAVMQDYHIFALSVADNVMLKSEQNPDREKIADALIKSGIYEKVTNLPDGIDTVLTREFDKNGIQLSGGEQQKLAISHVYSKENRFVILDEPSSALDPIAEYEMYERMNAACENCGMIFISHRLSSAVLADRVYLMENGTVLEEGTHESLMKKNGRYAEMFRRQAENYAEVTK